jgi:hypothetical protein
VRRPRRWNSPNASSVSARAEPALGARTGPQPSRVAALLEQRPPGSVRRWGCPSRCGRRRPNAARAPTRGTCRRRAPCARVDVDVDDRLLDAAAEEVAVARRRAGVVAHDDASRSRSNVSQSRASSTASASPSPKSRSSVSRRNSAPWVRPRPSARGPCSPPAGSEPLAPRPGAYGHAHPGAFVEPRGPGGGLSASTPSPTARSPRRVAARGRRDAGAPRPGRAAATAAARRGSRPSRVGLADTLREREAETALSSSPVPRRGTRAQDRNPRPCRLELAPLLDRLDR